MYQEKVQYVFGHLQVGVNLNDLGGRRKPYEKTPVTSLIAKSFHSHIYI